MMKEALAFLDWGRWVADCPDCSDAQLVYMDIDGAGPVRREIATCANGHVFGLVMPSPGMEAEIVAAVGGRPESERSWYPEGHERAEDAGLPVGQTVAELQERTDVIVGEADLEEQQKAKAREVLASLGVTINPDGSFAGQL